MIVIGPNTLVFLCDRSGIAARPWIEAGYSAVCVDAALQPGESFRDGIRFIGADVRTCGGVRGRPVGVFAFPPCTHLTNIKNQY